MGEKLDIIVFGATGYTGRCVVESLVKLGPEYELNWGVCGRNKDKLKELLKDISDKSGTNIKKTPKFIADVGDENSLKEMAGYTSAVINCAGPFRFLGEPVIKACIAAKTHHVDVSGEPQYMEQMQLKYHKEAEEQGVYLISACGFDSIPTELGIIHLMNLFKGQLNSVEVYLQSEYVGSNRKGASIHYGTWESAVYSLMHSDELKPLREELYPKQLPKLKPKVPEKSIMHWSSVVQRWCLPFPGSDRSIAYRTQRYFHDVENKRPIQIRTYMSFNSLFSALFMALFGVIFALMVKTSLTRRLLLNYPGFFSFGLVNHEGPTEDTRVNTLFQTTFHGQGWNENVASDKPCIPPNTPQNSMKIKLSGYDPGYAFTATALVLCTKTVLKESDNMPGSGGVYPPGAAFAKTSLLEELQKNGLKVEILNA